MLFGKDSQNQPRRSEGVGRHLQQWDGVVRPPQTDTKHGLQLQTWWGLSIAAPSSQSQPKAVFFPNFSHAVPPPPRPPAATGPGSAGSAQALSSPALCKLWPQPTAAPGPSCLESAKHQGPGEPGEAPGRLAPWVGCGSGARWRTCPGETAPKQGCSPFASPWPSPGARLLLLLLLLLQSTQPAGHRADAVAVPGSLVPLHCDAQLAPAPAMSCACLSHLRWFSA